MIYSDTLLLQARKEKKNITNYMKFPQEAKNNPKGSKPARQDSKHLKQNKDKTKGKNSFRDKGTN